MSLSDLHFHITVYHEGSRGQGAEAQDRNLEAETEAQTKEECGSPACDLLKCRAPASSLLSQCFVGIC